MRRVVEDDDVPRCAPHADHHERHQQRHGRHVRQERSEHGVDGTGGDGQRQLETGEHHHRLDPDHRAERVQAVGCEHGKAPGRVPREGVLGADRIRSERHTDRFVGRARRVARHPIPTARTRTVAIPT